jgi:hypothetical protein
MRRAMSYIRVGILIVAGLGLVTEVCVWYAS